MGKGRWAQIPRRFALIRLQVGDFTYWLTSRQGLGPLVSKVPSFGIRRCPFMSPARSPV